MPRNPLEQARQLVLLDMVESGPRFVEKQQFRAAGKCAGDFRQALMPVSESADADTGACREAYEIERRQRVALEPAGRDLSLLGRSAPIMTLSRTDQPWIPRWLQALAGRYDDWLSDPRFCFRFTIKEKSAQALLALATRTNVDFQIEIVPADGIRLPLFGSGGFGRSPFFGQLSVKANYLTVRHRTAFLRSHGVGDDDEGRALQGTCRPRGVKEIAPDLQRDVNGWEGRTARNAEPVDPAIRTTHSGQRIVECGLLTGT
jgi:hypothetical protein